VTTTMLASTSINAIPCDPEALCLHRGFPLLYDMRHLS
jgi:hypothetical protein